MNIFKSNINALKNYHPSLEKKINSTADNNKLVIEKSKSGPPTIKVNNKFIHSQYNPLSEADKIVDHFDAGECNTILVLGLGLGYHIKKLLNFGKNLIVIEPSTEIFKAALENTDFSSDMGNLDFRICEDPVMLGAEMADKEYSIFKHQGSERVFKEYFNLFEDSLNSNKHTKQLKIMVVGPIYGGSLTTARYVDATLKDMGHLTEFVDCSIYSDSYFKIEDITKDKINEGIVREKYLCFLGEMVIAKAVDFEPDIILALAQAPLAISVIERLKKSGVPLAFWFVEDYRVLAYWKKVAPYYDYFFTIQKGDFFNQLTNLGVKNKYFLPQACYPSIHKKVDLSSDEKIKYGSELSFVGAGYYNRTRFFRGITDYDFKIWGSDWTAVPPLGQLIQEKGRRVPPEEYIKIFNASTININLHSSTYHEGVVPNGDFINPRTFEIASCGGFQLVDKRVDMDDMFNIDSEIVCFENLSDLRDKIEYYLNNHKDREIISLNSQKRVLRDHTFESRLKLLLGVIYFNEREKIDAKIEDRNKKRSKSVNNVKKMIKDAGSDTELKRFLETFEDETLTMKNVMKNIETGSGAISKVEAIFMMINEIITEKE